MTIDEAKRLSGLSENDFNSQFMNFLDNLNAMPKPLKWLCPDCGHPVDYDFYDWWYCDFCEKPIKEIDRVRGKEARPKDDRR